MWNGSNFSGNMEVFHEGWYDYRNLKSIGNDKLVGLNIPANLKVTLYEHGSAGGKSETFYGPYKSPNVPNWSGKVSGIKVEKYEQNMS